MQARGQWASKAGFVLSTAGSAVGLANVWAFPYRTGQNGGAAFVVIYLLCIFLICYPFMLAEINLGRFSQKNAVGAIRMVRPRGLWLGLGGLCILAGFFILSFYSVVAGWSLGYIFKMLLGDRTPFPEFAATPEAAAPLLLLFLVLTVLVVYRGVQRGIERWAKLLMPTLLLLMLVLIVHGITLPGAKAGLAFFLMPDFSQITAETVMTAMGQAFFSLSLGIGGILTYGSYLSKQENIITCGTQIVLLDTFIALLAGLMIFPALFSFGQQPTEGPALVFIVLPAIFEQMPAGHFIGPLFFVMLTIAGLTSTIALMELLTAYFVDELGWKRKRIVWLIGLTAFVMGVPSALSQGAVPGLSKLAFWSDRSFLEFMIFLWFDVFPPLGGLLFSIFIGWVWGIENAARELAQGSPGFRRALWGLPITGATLWSFCIRYVCPLAILAIWITHLLEVLGY